MFTLYVFGLAPVFIALFIHLTRKVADVQLSDMIIIVICSFLPIAREVILLYLFSQNHGNKTLFRRYKD